MSCIYAKLLGFYPELWKAIVSFKKGMNKMRFSFQEAPFGHSVENGLKVRQILEGAII